MNEPTIIDYLCNAFAPDRAKVWDERISAQGITVKVRRDLADSFCSPEQMIARMDELGVATLVMPASDLSHHVRGDYDRLIWRFEEIESLAIQYPGRMVAWWAINPDAGSAGLKRMRQVIQNPWVVGMWIHTHSFDRRFDHADYYPYYALAAEHGLPVAMQAGTSGGLMPSECGHPLGIDRPAIFFPEVNFLLSHLGWPWTEQAIAMALKFPNVYLGTCAYPPKHWWPNCVEFMRRAGRRKVLFGTNFPTVGHRHALAQLPELGFSEEVRSLLMHENARAIFRRLGH